MIKRRFLCSHSSLDIEEESSCFRLHDHRSNCGVDDRRHSSERLRPVLEGRRRGEGDLRRVPSGLRSGEAIVDRVYYSLRAFLGRGRDKVYDGTPLSADFSQKFRARNSEFRKLNNIYVTVNF